MSYDLLIFDSAEVPTGSHAEVMEWYSAISGWDEDRDYENILGTSEPVAQWFLEMNKYYPAMSGPYAPPFDDVADEDTFCDYTIGSNFIYAAFAWSKSEAAEELARRLASSLNLAFYDLSGTDRVFLPDGGVLAP